MAAWSAGAVTMRDGASFEMCVPSKLFEVMGSAVPVVLAANGESAQIVRDCDCGLPVSTGDAEGFAAAVRRLRTDPALARQLGANGRRAAEQKYDRRQIAAAVADALAQARNT
jgi:glycosyltransferase involved in cell wall biosynthesis